MLRESPFITRQCSRQQENCIETPRIRVPDESQDGMAPKIFFTRQNQSIDILRAIRQ
jgi:hypothetical protein